MKILEHVASFSRFLRQKFSTVPILGPLVYSSASHHKNAAKDLCVILTFATATFWLTALLLLINKDARAIGYWGMLLYTVQSGELFIFSVGFIGPILLLALNDQKGHKEFPGRGSHVVALIVVGFVAVGFHSQIRAQIFRGTFDEADLSFGFTVSIYIACAAVLLRYLAMVYRQSTFDPEVEIKAPEANFANEYVRKHEAGDRP
ncbi:MAG: hypothetical protein SGJ20_05040 [Planctomycetota bacterium]|nr:hypothetical protein [Planctomycetota bacterium]